MCSSYQLNKSSYTGSTPMASRRLIILPKTIALVGMMGVGKTSIGRRLAKELSVPFKDSDLEVEAAAGQSVTDIFQRYGAQEFHDTERRVINRLLSEKPHILSTGVEAFVTPETRKILKEQTYCVWLRASLETLLPRVSRRTHRPQLEVGDKRAILEGLLAEYEPLYAEADIHIDCNQNSLDLTVETIINALAERFWT